MMNSVYLNKVSNLTGSPLNCPESDISRIKEEIAGSLEAISYQTADIRGSTVILKPNLVRPNPRLIPASSTDPRVVIAIAELCSDFGAREVGVGENPGFEYPAREAFEISGLTALLKKRGFKTFFFDDGEWVDIPNPAGRLYRNIRVAKPVMEAGVFINLPKWKTHMLTCISLSIKNLLGIIHDDQRMLFHRNDIAEKIVDLAQVRVPDLNIIDGLWAMEGQAPFHGVSIRDYNGLAVSTDMIALDSTVAEWMGFSISEIPHLMIARERIWNGVDHPVNVIGPEKDLLKRRFKRPVLSSAGQFPGFRCIECGVCNGCLSAIRHSLDKLAFESDLKLYPVSTIVSGRPMCNEQTLDEWEGNLILFGNCASEFQFYDRAKRRKGCWIPGCPPHVLDLFNLLEKLRD
ncbi:DUF362 domain-containing protein [bacterium]|nr:DUF362 domain-containing protein [candidate division CSSED10-310 bacterium]